MTESSRSPDEPAAEPASEPPTASDPPPSAPPPAAAYPPPPQAAWSPPPPAPFAPPPPAAVTAPTPPPVGGYAPQAPPAAVQQAEQVARQVAGQFASLSRGWWGRLDPQGKRPTLIVGGVLLAVVLGSQVLNGILPARAATNAPTSPTIPTSPIGSGQVPNGPRIIELAPGVRMQVYPGWQQVEDTISLPGARLQNGGTIVDVRVISGGAEGDHTGLLQAYLQQLVAPDAQQLTFGTANIVPINGRNGARVTYSGIFKGIAGTVRGEVTAIVFSGTQGVVVHGYTVDQDLESALNDIHGMTFTIEVR